MDTQNTATAAIIAAPAIDPDRMLTRAQLAVALTDAGFPTSKATLATKVSRGGGPPYKIYGVTPLYRWGDALAWAHGALRDPIDGRMGRYRKARARREPPSISAANAPA